MALTLADIQRWDATAIRDVSTALAKRGASAEEVRAGLGKLPLIATWQGGGGDAARASLDRLSAYLATHGEEMAKVSSATGNAADEIDGIKSTLQRINDDAVHEGFHVDPATGEVNPLNTGLIGDPIYAMQQADLEVRIKDLLAAANAAAADLARAITTAGDDAAGHPETCPDVLEALSRPAGRPERVPRPVGQAHTRGEGRALSAGTTRSATTTACRWSTAITTTV
jgi:hypothetical protein